MSAKPPDPRVLAQLEELTLDPTRPLLAVDADEVMVLLAAHLKRFLASHDIVFRLTSYRLEGSMIPVGSETPIAFEDCLTWIGRFFESEVTRQEEVEGAAAALERLADLAQIMVLTNVPRHGKPGRIENLAALGMGYPLVENAGGKGPALAWMAERVGRPMIFIDDSRNQIASAATTCPEVERIHFTGAELVCDVLDPAPEAQHHAKSWAEAEAICRRLLARAGPTLENTAPAEPEGSL
ncbi:MAG: hypothetical protein AAGF44_01295 [Pseudomonadota bacterium]